MTNRPINEITGDLAAVIDLVRSPHYGQVFVRGVERHGPNADHQPAILLRYRRGSEQVRDTGKLLGAASHEGDADGVFIDADAHFPSPPTGVM